MDARRADAPRGRAVAGLLVDLDGVVYRADGLVPGADRALAAIRRRRIPFRFLTNTTIRSRRALREHLAALGVPAEENEIVTTTSVAARWLRERGVRRVHLLLREEPRRDFAGFEITEEGAEAVVVGDMGRDVDFDRLNRAFLDLRRGARLVALQKGRFWQSPEGLALDAGAFVAALEYAAETEATLIGKPSEAYFRLALAELGLPAETVAMIGDDPRNDIEGARRVGLRAILVSTGKHRPGEPLPPGVEPDATLPSLASIVDWLEGASAADA